MIRALFGAQFAFFLSFGAVAGAAFSFYVDNAVIEAKREGEDRIITMIPLHALAEMEVRR